MIKRMRFSENWNGKLCLDVFTTIREYNYDHYREDDLFEIELKGEVIGIAVLLMRKPFPLKALNDTTAYTDCGHGAPYLSKLLRSFHKDLTPDSNVYMLWLQWRERNVVAQAELFKAWWQKCLEKNPSSVQQQLSF